MISGARIAIALKRTAALLAVLISVALASVEISYAQSTCSSIFTSATESGRLESVYGDLIHDIDSLGGKALSASQLSDFLESARLLLDDSRQDFLMQDSRGLTVTALARRDQVLARFQEYQRAVVQVEAAQKLTYKEGMSFLMSVNRLNEEVSRIMSASAFQKTRALEAATFFDAPFDIQTSLRSRNVIEPENKNGILIPVTRALSIRDFNRLVGTGLFPLGFAPRSIFVDGREMSPGEFTEHDKIHTAFMPGVFSKRSQKVWDSLLKWADTAPEPLSSLRHVVLFELSHETSVIQGSLFSKPTDSLVFHDPYQPPFFDVEEVSVRLERESLWDQHDLRQMKGLKQHLSDQYQLLEGIYRSAVQASAASN